MTNLSDDHVRVLSALRRASVLRREPRPLAPEGQQRWHSLAELRDAYWASDADLAPLDRAARGLYKQHLVSRRTLHTVVYWGITEEGLLALYAYDNENDLSDVSAAMLELDQANADLDRLQGQMAAVYKVVQRATHRVNEAIAARSARIEAAS